MPHPRTKLAVAVGALVLLVVGGLLFQPWQLFVNRRVDEAAPAPTLPSPTVPTTVARAPEPTASEPSTRRSSPTPRPTPSSTVLSTGELITHEHRTSGTVRMIELPDGQRILRFEDLETSSGPDLRVWLSAGPVREGRAGWFVFAQHPHEELGKLKANQGNQNYAVPDEVDLDDFASVSIWCRRFRVSFGAAALRPVAT